MTIIKWPWQNVGKTYLQLYEKEGKVTVLFQLI